MLKLGKIKLPHKKHTAGLGAARITPPATVTIPMAHHIGAAAIPCVKAGDKVCVGTKIANADGYISAPVHSSVSGTVKKIDSFLTAKGMSCPAVIIESDGEMTVDPAIKAPEVNNIDEFCEAIRESGLIGLGGAGFPTAVKLEAEKKGLIKKIIINAAECEPYITADTRTMVDDAEHIVKGVKVLERFISADEIIIGIEDNKPEAVAKMKESFKGDAKVRIEVLPCFYPQGEEKVIIYNTTGLVVPEGGLPFDVGCVVINVTSVAFIGYYFETGIPLVEKRITVDGSAVKNPKNVIAPVGTPIIDVLNAAGGLTDDVAKVLYGGPMMGVALYSVNDPVLKNTNAIVALSKADTAPVKQYPCIHCGKCISVCPMGLNPTAFVRAMKVEDKNERVQRFGDEHISICMECGCCSYVCPSHRPLVETNRLAKAEWRAAQPAKEN